MNRRDSLRLLAAAGALSTEPAVLAAEPTALAQPDPIPGSPAAQLERFIRMRSAPDHTPVLWVHGGVLMLKPEGESARSVLRVAAVSMTQAVPRGPGVYDWRLDEIGYYLDLDGREVVERWTNPWTGESRPPRHYRSPEYLVIRAGGAVPRDPLPEGAEFRGEITDLYAAGDRVTMTEDLYVSMPGVAGDPTRPPRRLASLGTFTASATQLAAPRSRWVDCEFTYATMNSFAPWLGMGARPGVQNMRLVGSKFPATRFSAIPRWLRRRIEQQHPTFFDLPKLWAL